MTVYLVTASELRTRGDGRRHHELPERPRIEYPHLMTHNEQVSDAGTSPGVILVGKKWRHNVCLYVEAMEKGLGMS